jgi:hypothetical protein
VSYCLILISKRANATASTHKNKQEATRKQWTIRTWTVGLPGSSHAETTLKQKQEERVRVEEKASEQEKKVRIQFRYV